MLKALLHPFFGLTICLLSAISSFSQPPCDCVGAGNCPLPINDNSLTTIEMPVNLPGIPDLATCPLEKVCITLTHTWIGDLSISLISPNGEHYLIMADVGNNYGECGTQQDNAEFCITTGTSKPLMNNTEYACNAAPCSLGTCCLNGNWTVPCGGVTSPLTGATQAPGCNLNAFNLPGAPANGVWTLMINDVCNMDIGILHNFSLKFGCDSTPIPGNCAADGGVLGIGDVLLCSGQPMVTAPMFCNGTAPSADFSYAHVIAQNASILAVSPQPDLTGFPAGSYEIWGLSYLATAEAQLASLVGQPLQTVMDLLDSDTPPFCADFSGDSFEATIIDQFSVNLGPDLVLDCWETSHTFSALEFPSGNGFHYAWTLPSGDTSAGEATITFTESGDYIFTASDSTNTCTDADTINITIPPPLINSISVASASCDQANGAASVVLQPGIANATYAWSNGGTAQTNTGLAQGWYSVTVSDNYCTYHQNFYVDEDRSCKVTIKGKIWNDNTNQDCQTDSTTVGVECIMLHLLPADIYTYSQADGSYEFVVDAGDYTINYVDEDNYDLLCPVSGSIPVSLPVNGSISEGNNFYVEREDEPNLCINMCFGAARPGFTQSNHFQYCNLGLLPVDAVITLVHDSLLQDGNLSAVATTYDPTTNTATWVIENIPPGGCQTIHYQMTLPATVPIGTPLAGSIGIEPSANDTYPVNNFDEWTQWVVGSYDPNEKSSLTGENQWGGLITANDTIITYQVMFQNTGTDTAFTVVLRDTLDANLDVETIRPGMASHPYQLEFEGNNVLVFNFRDIMLPDSNRNEPASHGYATFTIKRRSGMALGTEIRNSAAIFFDYNAPVITNETTHRLGKYVVHSQSALTLCYGELLNGTAYLTDTTLLATYSFANYDSIVTTHVDVLPPAAYNFSAPICEGSTYFFNNQLLMATGDYTMVLPSANGCDSTVVLSLAVLPFIETTIEATICEGGSISFGGEMLLLAGIYQNSYTAAGGCDSTVTLALTVLGNVATTLSAMMCSGETYSLNGQTLAAAGTYSAILPSANGCDSTVTLTLALLPTVETAITSEICAGESLFFNGQTLTNPGIYSSILPSANGCDSTVTLTLALLPTVETSLAAEICEGETLLFNGQTLSAAGTYTSILPSANGCDSTVTLTLALLPTVETSLAAEICEGESYAFGEFNLTQSGDYQAVTPAENGCDSTVSLHLTVNPVYASFVETEILLGSTWNGVSVFSDTTIISVFEAANGCDSTVTVQLSVLTSTRSLTGPKFDLLVFPNPFDASATLEIKGFESGKPLTFKLLDVTGRLAQQQAFRSPSYTFSRGGLPSGMYFVKIEEEGRLVALGRVVAK